MKKNTHKQILEQVFNTALTCSHSQFLTTEVKKTLTTIHLISIIKDKIYKHNPKRYCVFSTRTIKSPKDKTEIDKIVLKIRKQHGCQVIINGVLPTFRYYLRLISSKKYFLNKFIGLVNDDSELQSVHKNKVIQLLKISMET